MYVRDVTVEICSRCQHPVVPECGGQGYVRTEDLTVRPCKYIVAKQLRGHLGEEIASVQFVRSPLFVENAETREIVTDLTTQNLWIKTQWPGFLPHLKWTLGRKGVMFQFRVVTDTRIKSVFCGDEQYKARPVSMREDTQVYNNLEDLLGKDIDLAIIKLGYLGYKNRAAPGALKEALMLRDACQKPTWVVEDTRNGYEWTHSRSLEVEDYIGRFDEITIEPVADVQVKTVEAPGPRKPSEGSGIIVDEADDDVPLIPSTRLPKANPRPRPSAKYEEPQDDPDPPSPTGGGMDFLDGGGSKKRKFKKKGSGW